MSKITFKTLTMKNFYGVGNITQTVDFNSGLTTLILGLNKDVSGEGSRNGVGKTTCLNALSYVLYDEPISKIKKENLINKTNGKNMLVTLDFNVDGTEYRIERGRKSNILRLFTNGKETDESQGENKDTQEDIVKIIGMSHTAFCNVVCFSTEVTPFLKLKPASQREVIEEILGITEITRKADTLKKELSETKKKMNEEQVRITTQEQGNMRIQSSIDLLKSKAASFESEKKEKMQKIALSITKLKDLDIDNEITNHTHNAKFLEIKSTIETISSSLSGYKDQISTIQYEIDEKTKLVDELKFGRCPTCGNDTKHNHNDKIEEYNNRLSVLIELIDNKNKEKEKLSEKLSKLQNAVDNMGEYKTTVYKTLDEAYNHKYTLDALVKRLTELKQQENAYLVQTETIVNSMVTIDYTQLNSLTDIYEHQDFLYKMLSRNDSPVRKMLVNQNLTYLNKQLAYYLEEIGLPHIVKFMPDMTVEILYLGNNYDYPQLSAGERRRLELALCWAFRDVYENRGNIINLMFVDEMLDSGLDPLGVNNCVNIISNIATKRSKDVVIISHREELVSRMQSILYAIKESGFTSYSLSEEL